MLVWTPGGGGAAGGDFQRVGAGFEFGDDGGVGEAPAEPDAGTPPTNSCHSGAPNPTPAPDQGSREIRFGLLSMLAIV